MRPQTGAPHVHDPSAAPSRISAARRQSCVDRDIHRHDFPVCAASVLGAADVRQDGAAAARRLAVGVVGGDGLLSRCAAARLRLRACVDTLSRSAPCRHRAPLRFRAGAYGAAACDRGRMGQAAGGLCRAMADRFVRRLDRIAVLRGRGQCPDAAGMVCAHRPPAGAGSILSLWRVQSRLIRGVTCLSGSDRAVPDVAGTDRILVGGLRRADDVHCGCGSRVGADLPCRGEAIVLHRAFNRTLARPAAMDGARFRAVCAAHRGHLAYLDRHCVGAVPVDRPARALPRHLRAHLPPWRRTRARYSGAGAALCRGAAGDRPDAGRARLLDGRHHARSRNVRDLGHDLPSRALPAASRGFASDRILSVDLGRRRARRHCRGLAGAGHFS